MANVTDEAVEAAYKMFRSERMYADERRAMRAALEAALPHITAGTERAVEVKALRQIIARSHSDLLGTSKVLDMRRIAEDALGSDGKGPRIRALSGTEGGGNG